MTGMGCLPVGPSVWGCTREPGWQAGGQGPCLASRAGVFMREGELRIWGGSGLKIR